MPMKTKALLFALIFLLLPLRLAAQEGPALETLQEGLYKGQLDNGLEIYLLEDRALPLVTIEMAVRNGAYTEPPDYNGLSHVYEHMFFKGNAAIPSQEAYLARQRELGMLWNGTTSTERVNYFFTLTSDNTLEGLEFMRDAIMTPLFDEEELAKERIVILDEFSRNEANPYHHLIKAIDGLLWYRYPSRKDSLGERAVIDAVTPEQMRTVQGRYYIPNNSALFVAGDIDPPAIAAAIADLYGHWEAGADPFEAFPIPEHPPLERSQAVVVEQPIQKVVVRISWHGPDTEHDRKATYAADVFSAALGQQSSKLSMALVESGLAFNAALYYLTQKHVGPINLVFSTTPERLPEALGVVAEQLEAMDDEDYLSEQAIETAKTLLETDDIYSREKSSQLSHTLSFWWASAGLDYYLGYLEQLRAVERADMQAYVRRYIQGKPYVVGVLLSPENQAELQLDEAKILSWLNNAATATEEIQP